MTTLALSALNVRALWRRLLGLVVLVTVSAAVCIAAFAVTQRAENSAVDRVQEGVANRSLQLDRLGDRADAKALTGSAIAQITGTPGVSSVEPVTQASFGYKSATVPGVLLYATTPRASVLPPVVKSVRDTTFPLATGEIVLPATAAGNDLTPLLGTDIEVQITRSTGVGQGAGVAETVHVVGLFDPSWQLDNPDAAYLDAQTVVEWAALRAGVPPADYPETVGYDSVTVVAASAAAVPGLLAGLQHDGFAASSLQQQLTELPTVLALIRTAGLILLICLVLVTGFSAYQVTSALGRQRVREVGILKAVGFSDLRVFRMLVAEALLVAVLSAVVGLVAGTVVSSAGNAVLRTMGDLQSYLPAGLVLPDLPTVLALLAIVVLVIGVGAALPALRAARMQPAEAIREW